MEPCLLKRVTSSAGRVIRGLSPAAAFTACSASVSEQLSRMMKDAVQGGGSGARAAVTTMDIRGKTGTSVSSSDGRTVSYGLFTGFNAQKDLPFALCVLVEDIPDGETGGTTAACVAHDIFTYLKNHPETALP